MSVDGNTPYYAAGSAEPAASVDTSSYYELLAKLTEAISHIGETVRDLSLKDSDQSKTKAAVEEAVEYMRQVSSACEHAHIMSLHVISEKLTGILVSYCAPGQSFVKGYIFLLKLAEWLKNAMVFLKYPDEKTARVLIKPFEAQENCDALLEQLKGDVSKLANMDSENNHQPRVAVQEPATNDDDSYAGNPSPPGAASALSADIEKNIATINALYNQPVTDGLHPIEPANQNIEVDELDAADFDNSLDNSLVPQHTDSETGPSALHDTDATGPEFDPRSDSQADQPDIDAGSSSLDETESGNETILDETTQADSSGEPPPAVGNDTETELVGFEASAGDMDSWLEESSTPGATLGPESWSAQTNTQTDGYNMVFDETDPMNTGVDAVSLDDQLIDAGETAEDETPADIMDKSMAAGSDFAQFAEGQQATIPDTIIPDTIIPDAINPDDVIADAIIPDDVIPDASIPDDVIADNSFPDDVLLDEVIPEAIPNATDDEDTAEGADDYTAPNGFFNLEESGDESIADPITQITAGDSETFDATEIQLSTDDDPFETVDPDTWLDGTGLNSDPSGDGMNFSAIETDEDGTGIMTPVHHGAWEIDDSAGDVTNTPLEAAADGGHDPAVDFDPPVDSDDDDSYQFGAVEQDLQIEDEEHSIELSGDQIYQETGLQTPNPPLTGPAPGLETTESRLLLETHEEQDTAASVEDPEPETPANLIDNIFAHVDVKDDNDGDMVAESTEDSAQPDLYDIYLNDEPPPQANDYTTLESDLNYGEQSQHPDPATPAPAEDEQIQDSSDLAQIWQALPSDVQPWEMKPGEAQPGDTGADEEKPPPSIEPLPGSNENVVTNALIDMLMTAQQDFVDGTEKLTSEPNSHGDFLDSTLAHLENLTMVAQSEHWQHLVELFSALYDYCSQVKDHSPDSAADVLLRLSEWVTDLLVYLEGIDDTDLVDRLLSPLPSQLATPLLRRSLIERRYAGDTAGTDEIVLNEDPTTAAQSMPPPSMQQATIEPEEPVIDQAATNPWAGNIESDGEPGEIATAAEPVSPQPAQNPLTIEGAESPASHGLPKDENLRILHEELQELEEPLNRYVMRIMQYGISEQDLKAVLDKYLDPLARIIVATEAMNLLGVQMFCDSLSNHVASLGYMDLEERRQLQPLLDVWPKLLLDYLRDPNNEQYCLDLVNFLHDRLWPNPINGPKWRDIFTELYKGIQGREEPEHDDESRQIIASESDVSLEIAADTNQSIIDAFLIESPGQCTSFNAHVAAIARNKNIRFHVEHAQRISHTLKGSANLIGLKGVANMAHHMEDIFEYLYNRDVELIPKGLASILQEAADCIEVMVESVLGRDEPPADALNILQSLLDWANRLDQGDINDWETMADVNVDPAIDTTTETDEHAVESPAEESPAEESPAEESPAEESPAIEFPVAESGLEEFPAAEFPAAESPITESPITESPVPESTVAEFETKESPITDSPIGEFPTVETVPDDPVEPQPVEQFPDTNFRTSFIAGPAESEAMTSSQPETVETRAPKPDSEAKPSGRAAAPEQDKEPATKVSTGLSEEVVRIPASTVDELFRLVGETTIAHGQSQEQLRKLLQKGENLRILDRVLQEKRFELEDMVDIRGLSAMQKRLRSEAKDFDPLEMDHYDDLYGTAHSFIETVTDYRELSQQIQIGVRLLDGLFLQQRRIHKELEQTIMTTRMEAVDTICARLQRSIRQACRATGKTVELFIEGENLMVASELLNKLSDPLMHMLRNAVDHGIESEAQRRQSSKPVTGRVDLRFSQDGNHMTIVCRDDGGGLDYEGIRRTAVGKGIITENQQLSEPELARLILAPGFSTRDKASQLSGRGVGMDVVHSTITQLKGTIHIDNGAEGGTVFTIRLPVNLVTQHCLVVSVCEKRFALPTDMLTQILAPGTGRINKIGRDYAYRLNDDMYTLHDLAALLSLGEGSIDDTKTVLLVRTETGEQAVVIDHAVNSYDLVTKKTGKYVNHVHGILGVSILGDGSLVPVLDLYELLNAASKSNAPAHAVYAQTRPTQEIRQRHRILIVDDSLSVRTSLSELVTNIGFEAIQARDGVEAIGKLDQNPSLMLVDLEMPRMNGLEFTKHVRSKTQTRHIPIIMITSRTQRKHREEAVKAGVNHYITKPYSAGDLADSIERYLEA